MLHEAGEVLESLLAVSTFVRSVGDPASPGAGAIIGQSLGVQKLAGGLMPLHEAECRTLA